MNISRRDWSLKYQGCIAMTTPEAKLEMPLVTLGAIHYREEGGREAPDEDEGTVGEDRGRDNDVVSVDVSFYNPPRDGHDEDVYQRRKTLPIDQIIFKRLPLGVKNLTRTTFILLQGRPEGGYKYKILTSPEMLRIGDPIAPLRRVLDLQSPSETLHWEVLKAIIGEYPTQEEALLSVDQGEALSKAFSPKYHYSLDLGSRDITLLYKHKIAGRVTDGGVKLTKLYLCLAEELEALGVTINRSKGATS